MTQDETYSRVQPDAGPYADVDNLASRVISMLCERQVQTSSGVRQYVLDYVMRAILRRQDFDAAMVLDELRGQRLTLDAIIDIYIPEAAIEMGEMWVNSELDFAGVTIGALRLQALLGEASADMMSTVPHQPGDLSALVVIPPGEQHFLGANIVAAQVRRLGCAVSMSFAESEKSVLTRAEMDRPDMILFSCARVEALETIGRTVKKIRLSVDPAPVIAVGGALKGDAERIKAATGADLVTHKAKDVVGFCTKRLKALTRK